MNKNKISLNFLISFCIFFCVGIVVASRTQFSFLFFYSAAVLSVIGCLFFLRREIPFSVGICAVAFFLGACVIANSRTFSASHIASVVSRKAESVSLRGVIVSDPDARKGRSTFVVSTRELTQEKMRYRIHGRVQVSVFRKEKFSYGDEVVLTGSLMLPRDYKKFRYRDFLRQQGIYAVMMVRAGQGAVILRTNQASPVQAMAFNLKHKVQALTRQYMSGVPEAVLEAMLLGDKRDIPAALNTLMMQTGTIHILVVSGFNVGIVAFVILLLLKIIRIPRRLRYVLAIVCIILYCLMTGASVPVVRATVMGIAVLAGMLLRRQMSVYQSLALAALIILAFAPEQLFNAGFQLSFMSVFALVCFSPKIYALFPQKMRALPLVDPVVGVFSVSLAAWLGTAGIIAYYFHTVSPIAVAANMVIAPLASLITAAALSLVGVCIVFAPLAHIFSAAVEGLVLVLIKSNILFAQVPGGLVSLRAVSGIEVCIYYSILFGLVLAYRQWRDPAAP